MTTLYDLDKLKSEIHDLRSDLLIRETQIDTMNDKYAEFERIIDRQRNALQLLLNAIWIHINSGGSDEQLQDAYRLVSSASTMTGTTEE